MATDWEQRRSGLLTPRVLRERTDETRADLPEQTPGTTSTGAEHRLTRPLATLASLSAAIGAAGFVASWAFYTTFYDRFGLTPEQVGLDFAAIGARSAFLLLPWWAAIVALVLFRAALPGSTARLLPATTVLGIATAIYCWYVSHGITEALLNPRWYAQVPRTATIVLAVTVVCLFMARPGGYSDSPTSRAYCSAVIWMTAAVGLGFATYGRAEAAASLVAEEALQVQVRSFPDIDVLNVTQVRLLPSASAEGKDLDSYRPPADKPTAYDPRLRLSTSSIVNRAIQGNTCLLFLGTADGVSHFWAPGVGLGGDTGEVLSIPTEDIIVRRALGPAPDECTPIGNGHPIEITTVELP